MPESNARRAEDSLVAAMLGLYSSHYQNRSAVTSPTGRNVIWKQPESFVWSHESSRYRCFSPALARAAPGRRRSALTSVRIPPSGPTNRASTAGSSGTTGSKTYRLSLMPRSWAAVCPASQFGSTVRSFVRGWHPAVGSYRIFLFCRSHSRSPRCRS